MTRPEKAVLCGHGTRARRTHGEPGWRLPPHRHCRRPRTWRTSPGCWCPRIADRPGVRRGWRSCRRRRTCGGRSDRRTHRLARPYCKDVSPPLKRYAELLLDWNRSVNLTGARTLAQVEAQVTDAAALLAVSWEGIRRVIDIGSGGGLPAVPISLGPSQGEVHLPAADAQKG